MDEHNEFAEQDAARAQADADEESLSSQYVQALGLLSTIKGDMLVNFNDPIGMAKEIEAYVSELRQQAGGTEAQLDKVANDLRCYLAGDAPSGLSLKIWMAEYFRA
ncbi:MAG: hypothetical protein U0X20_07920 [Caldilineaceae bacterium]